MIELIGNRIKSDTGTIIGVYNAEEYMELMATKGVYLFNWDITNPGWKEHPIIIVKFDQPVPQMSRKEVAEYYEMPVEAVSDKLYNSVVVYEKYMTVPYHEVL